MSQLIRLVDNFLNKITMYRLLLYFLITLEVAAFILSLSGVLPYSIYAILMSLGVILITSLVSNKIFADVFEAVPNVESVYLTALILALIITPSTDIFNLAFMFWAAVLATGSKYILAFRKKHLFNPAAIAVVITAIVLNQSASWWVGTSSLLPLVAIGGLLMVRKIHRFDLAASFIVTATVVGITGSLLSGAGLNMAVKQLVVYSPLFFFAFVMLTEPLTTPPTRGAQIIYGGLTGFLFAPQVHLGNLYMTPELALVAGNLFSYLVSPKMKSVLTLKKIEKAAKDTYDFVFDSDAPIHFRPGQFLEWTLPVSPGDDRGNRRWFTIASSPTEKQVRIGVKFYNEPSQFKRSLASIKVGSKIMAGSLSGNFTLSGNSEEKSVFMAGGIGVTPFRSMAKYLIDTRQQRDIVMLYSNGTAEEIAYADIFNQARPLGLRTVYTLTNKSKAPSNWPGSVGAVDEAFIRREVPDFLKRRFYISGPQGMVRSFEGTLKKMGVHTRNIVTDYFPGFA